MTLRFRLQRRILVLLVLFSGLVASLPAQSGAADALSLARKKAAETRGLKGEDRARIQEEALRAFARVVSEFPDAVEERARARLEMARLERTLGRPERALAQLDAITGGDGPPEIRARALALAGATHKAAGEVEAALAAWRSLIADHPGEERLVAETRLDVAALLKRRKAWREARLAAEEVLEKHPDLLRAGVDAADFVVSLSIARRDWAAATAKLAECDALLRRRFGGGEEAERLEKALAKMRSRRALTPIPEDGEGGEDDGDR